MSHCPTRDDSAPAPSLGPTVRPATTVLPVFLLSDPRRRQGRGAPSVRPATMGGGPRARTTTDWARRHSKVRTPKQAARGSQMPVQLYSWARCPKGGSAVMRLRPCLAQHPTVLLLGHGAPPCGRALQAGGGSLSLRVLLSAARGVGSRSGHTVSRVPSMATLPVLPACKLQLGEHARPGHPQLSAADFVGAGDWALMQCESRSGRGKCIP